MSDQEDRPILNNEEPNEQDEDVEGHKKVYAPEEEADVEGHKFSNKATNKPAL
jgi:hypothetical protein